MLLVRRRFIFTVLLAVAIRFPFALAKRNPASSFSHHHHHDSRKTSKNVFGLYERDGRPAERFELPTKSVSIFTSDICSDDGTTSTIKLPLQITATHGSLEKRSLSHMKASVLTLLLFGSIAHCWFFDGHRLFRFGTKANGSGKLVSVVIAILLYWIEAMTCSTRRYLGNALSPKKVQHYLETLKSVPPSVLWTIECYHYRTVYHRYGSARNHQKRQETTERIVTHRASQQYSFQSWKDDTDTSTIERLLFSDQTSTSTAIHKAFSKITLAKLLLFANDESCHDYIDQESQFRNLWQNRDSHYDFHVQFHMDGLLPKILAVHHSLAGPGLARSLWFYVFTCFGMTVPYRIWFSRHCTNVEVTVTKEVTGWEYGL